MTSFIRMAWPFLKFARLAIAPACLLLAHALGAQTDPSLHWRTIVTPHFQVSFSPGLEETARRAAGSAERAYANLSKELAEPRVPISKIGRAHV